MYDYHYTRFILVDTKSEFLLVPTTDMQSNIYKMKYGEFALFVSNVDFIEMKKLIDSIYGWEKNTLDTNESWYLVDKLEGITYKEIPADVDQFGFKKGHDILNEYCNVDKLKKELEALGLNGTSSFVLATLMITEIGIKCMNGNASWKDPNSYMPLVFLNKNKHDDIKKYLLDKNFFEKNIAKEQIPKTLNYNELGFLVIKDIETFLLLDIQAFHASSKSSKILECQNCHRLFFPRRLSEKYCQYTHKGKKELCAEIVRKENKDEFKKRRENARGSQHSIITNESNAKKYDREFLYTIYDEWSKKCGKKFTEYKKVDDIKGFESWIEETKFKTNKLEELWKEWKRKNSNSVS